MRITIPVSGDGDAWMSHLPEINFEFDKILDTNGKLVLSEVVVLFARANEFCESHGYRPTFMTRRSRISTIHRAIYLREARNER